MDDALELVELWKFIACVRTWGMSRVCGDLFDFVNASEESLN